MRYLNRLLYSVDGYPCPLNGLLNFLNDLHLSLRQDGDFDNVVEQLVKLDGLENDLEHGLDHRRLRLHKPCCPNPS